MSRRPPNPAAEKAARNAQVIKDLLKLEPNKLCADCKRNKHPRWASWNLGVFVCIRCSGIHRGMGTHISRVKSVDLDSWTDEQLNSIVRWGNARAKRYWEAKLSPDHVPSESKIENFIRTKYELKRWVMDGPMPDPATLDEVHDDEDEDVPLAVVKEKQLERNAAAAAARPAQSVRAPPATADLIGGVDDPAPARASSGPPAQRVPPKAEPAPPKTTTTTSSSTAASKDSLLGLDFFQPAAPPRPASTTGSRAGSAAGGPSRPDLKQSILSLYASAPKPQHQPASQPPAGGGMFGSVPSPTSIRGSGSLAGLNDAFGGLNFSAQPPKPADPFAGLGGASMHSPKPSQSSSNGGGAFGGLGAGSFFDTKPAQPATTMAPHQRQASSTNSNSAFGDFGSFASPAPSTNSKPARPSAFDDLFDFASSASPATAKSPPANTALAAAPASTSSVFNLSSPAAPSAAPALSSTTSTIPSTSAVWATSEVWDSNAWSTPDAKSPNLSTTTTSQTNNFGWGSATTTATATTAGSLASQSIVPGASGFTAAPKVAADEEFGGWTRSTAAPAATVSSKPVGGFGANDDLFSNVWQ